MDQLERQQKRFLYAFLLALFQFVLNPVLLFFGFCFLAAGHGDDLLWNLGVTSCLLFNLTLLMTVVTSYPLRKQDIERTFIFYMFLFFFLAYGVFSFWGLLHL
ncbi:hypothetical protein F1728_10565 [Gimesia benthica]|uniref:Uncharacterized protein n=1 Tax=Gimesia benthica TaxID=2608982 RepID=A0A6I6AAF5_9PLAN|nr:hypothetical protein [Gimesia benthica]QGQ23086.1 hypothetical protein F1728_10565 [Gimesia benthica]